MPSNSSAFTTDRLIVIAGLLREPASTRPLVFTLVLLFYSVALVGNALLIAAIIRDARLHRPMFLLLANLALSDIVGCTATLPRIMHDLVAPNLISVPDCITQVMAIHFYRALECYVLSAMALDRYVAICRPLHYNAAVTNARVLALNGLIVAAALVLLVILGAMIQRLALSECMVSLSMRSAHCDNTALSAMSCIDSGPNNAYGVAEAVLTIGLSLVVVTFSYGRIICEVIGVTRRRGGAGGVPGAAGEGAAGSRGHVSGGGVRNRAGGGAGGAAEGAGGGAAGARSALTATFNRGREKTLRTCVTHLLVLTVFYVPVVFVILYNRINDYVTIPATVRQGLGCLFYVAPPALNPVIYGLRTGAIRRAVASMRPRWLGGSFGKGPRAVTVVGL